LLSGYPRHSSLYALELAVYDAYNVTTLVMTTFRLHETDEFIVDARDVDKVHHTLVIDGQGRILAAFIGYKVVVIITKVVMNGIKLEEVFNVFFFCVQEDEVRKQRLGDSFFLSVGVSYAVVQREVVFYAVYVEDLTHLKHPAIRHSQNPP
jgi:hypothetical protein